MPKLLVLSHFYRPDDVAGAVHFSGLCEGLAERGWEVEAWPSNRSCHHLGRSYGLKKERLAGVMVRRVWRPGWRQHSFLGRMANSIWMLAAWALRAVAFDAPDVVLTATDPLFTVGLTPWLKFLYPKARMAHWCFDLYPEYPIAEGIISGRNPLVGMIRRGLKWAYGACDLVVDLGPRMRELLEPYHPRRQLTLTPWAQEEPEEPLVPDPVERQELFGETPLGLLYSGNFGRPHGFDLALSLARKMRGQAVFAYSARGSRLEELKAAVTPDDGNVHFVPFAPPDRLAARLSAPDVQMVSLMPHWTGVAVPSKFFGALGVGRPVLFEGDERSDIAEWIKQYGTGWVLTPSSLEGISAELLRFALDPQAKAAMFRRCHEVYRLNFSRKAVVDRWDLELKKLLDGARRGK